MFTSRRLHDLDQGIQIRSVLRMNKGRSYHAPDGLSFSASVVLRPFPSTVLFHLRG